MRKKKEERYILSPSRLEPTVENVFNPFEGTLASPGRDGDVVNLIPMKIRDIRDTRKLF